MGGRKRRKTEGKLLAIRLFHAVVNSFSAFANFSLLCCAVLCCVALHTGAQYNRRATRIRQWRAKILIIFRGPRTVIAGWLRGVLSWRRMWCKVQSLGQRGSFFVPRVGRR